jgi:hypothetical protein
MTFHRRRRWCTCARCGGSPRTGRRRRSCEGGDGARAAANGQDMRG